LSESLGREIRFGKIIHGDNYASLKLRIAALTSEVRKLTRKISNLLSSNSPADLVLNRHCGECEFRDRCRQKTIEKDDLSLLSRMTEKERKSSTAKASSPSRNFPTPSGHAAGLGGSLPSGRSIIIP
jgi:hypothetical protein